jgi:hypothetical protein
MARSKADRAARRTWTERLNRIEEGINAEVAAVQQVLRTGKEILIPPREGSLMQGKVAAVRNCHDGIWVTMQGHGGSFALGNDARWEQILELAGVERDDRAAAAFAR